MNALHLIIYFLLLVPPLVFFTDLTRNPYFFQIVLLNAATVFLWMVWLYRGYRERRLIVRRTPLDLPLLAFLLVATVSWAAVLAGNLAHPYLRYSIYSEGMKRWLFLLVNALLVYYAAVHFVDKENRPRFMLAVFWAGLIASVYGILQYFGIELIWPRVLNPFGGRSVSTFGNPNFLSSYLVLLIPPAYLLYLEAAGTARRIFYLAVTVIYFIALLCTLTRSSWLGLFVGMTVALIALFVFERQLFAGRSLFRLLAPFAVMGFLVFTWPSSSLSGYNPNVVSRLSEAVQVHDTPYGARDQRILIWSSAWHMVIENPLLGKGWGCFELFYPFYQGRHLFLPVNRNMRTHANNTHNEVLEIWSQTGTAGLGIYLWLLACILVFTHSLVKNTEGRQRYLAIGLSAALIGVWVDNLLNVSLHFAVPGFLAWWNLGLLIGLGRNEERTVALKLPRARLLVLAALAFGAVLIVRYSRNFVGEIHYFSGFKHSKRNAIPAAIPELEAAHRNQRFEVNNNYELANCYARSGLRDKAIDFYREALRANAGYDEIYFNMATVLLQSGESEKALQEYTRALFINPISLEAYNALGSIFLQDTDRFRTAGIALFKQCLVIFPDNKDIWNNLGYLYTKSDMNEEAVDAYKKAIEIDPGFEMARRNLRVSLGRLNRTDRFLEEMDGLFGAVERDIAGKNWQKALSSCDLLVQRVPRSFKARLYRANILFTLGRLPDAITEYHEALKLSPANTSAAGNLALAYFENKQFERAKQEFENILRVEPQNQMAREKLAQISSILSSAPYPPSR